MSAGGMKAAILRVNCMELIINIQLKVCITQNFYSLFRSLDKDFVMSDTTELKSSL